MAHYSMGGIEADINGRTKIENIWASGEVACHSMHGANRLGCNSTAECLVWGGITGGEIANYLATDPVLSPIPEAKANKEEERIFIALPDWVCPTLATDVRYLGPMPLTALQRYNADSRDEGLATRANIAGGDGGAFSCHYAGECSRVCPKGVDPGKAIQHLKRKLVLDYLHLAGRKKSCRKLDGPGEGKLLPNMTAPPKDHRKSKGQVGDRNR